MVRFAEEKDLDIISELRKQVNDITYLATIDVLMTQNTGKITFSVISPV